MPDRHIAGQRRKIGFPEHLRNQPHPGMHRHLFPGGGDPGAFLPPMLQGEKPEKGEAAGAFLRRINRNHPALLAGAIPGAAGHWRTRQVIHGGMLFTPSPAAANPKADLPRATPKGRPAQPGVFEATG